MIVLDTNVVSELMRSAPDPVVSAWAGDVDGPDLFTSTITVAEISHGLHRLPKGSRRTALMVLADEVFRRFDDRILAFDRPAAERYGELVASREAIGRPISIADAQIAAISLVNDATLATRNRDDFAALDLALIDPWRTRDE